MKASKSAAAIRCAVAGRIAGQAGKFGMGRLVRKSHLSVLHPSVACSIVAGYSEALGISFTGTTSLTIRAAVRKPDQLMHMQDTWRQDGDSRLAGNRMRESVMPSQKNPTQKALALA